MRVSVSRLVAAILFFASALWAEVSFAALTVQTTTCSSGELTMTLKVPTKAIEGDARTFCRMDITITGAADPFVAGDQVLVQAIIDDSYFGADTAFYSSSFTVTSQEVAAQKVQRTIDCTGDFHDNGYSTVAIYGFVDADKGQIWDPDRCAPNTVDVSIVGDDSPDNDDTAAAATQLGTGVSNKVAADQDWYAVTVNGQSNLALTLAYDGGSGALDFVLTDSGGTSLATGTKTAEGAVINKSGLSAGTYKVKVAPTSSADPNFYDLKTGTQTGGGDGGTCTGTGTEQRDCGKCGSQSRTCTSGTWSTWTSCTGQGECEAGETDIEACGTNKSRTLTCNDSCEWEPGACVNGTDGGGGSGGGGSNAGKTGLACEDNTPCGGLECVGLSVNDGMFRNGYCSMSGCNSDSACGDSSALCGGLFGETYCLKRCSDSTDCRSGYVCARFGNARGCAPRCRDDDDCADNALPVCDDDSGLCLASAGADPQSWNGARPNADGTVGAGALLEAGGGCVEIDTSIWTVIFGAFLMMAHITARRTAARAATYVR